ncbi:MSHA biogenesis protein MshK [Sulfuricystis multivorans]|uniref:MSHA biogenesis protein MshK n=1 Tax=Sulfuricystis multivorans TaxID=2211108 RepID=UPI000F8336EE|nr:MSHA biogenesis protein MshK [Sulfuricystis multivorans]
MARRLISLLPMLWFCAGAQAQGADPTRPPFDSGPAAQSGAAQEAASGLQSILRRKAGKPAAMINGTVVELGGKVGEARLTRIGEDFVVLRGPQGIETLYLTPGVKKTPRKEKR